MRSTFVGKALAIVGIVAILMIALWHIEDVVDERRMRQLEAQASVEQSQAAGQTVMGPVLRRSCTEEWDSTQGEGRDARPVVERRELLLSAVPTQLDVNGQVALEARQRGLFKINGYAARTRLDARWADLAALQPSRSRADSRMNCGPAVMMVAVSDARGIRSAQVKVDAATLAARPGTTHATYTRGFHAVLPESTTLPAQADQALTAQVDLELLGTSELSLVPVAMDTQVKWQSDWPHPSFAGRFLPATREVRTDGFDASWRVSSLATTAPADYLRGAPLCDLANSTAGASLSVSHGGSEAQRCIDTLGVSFIDPVNPYVLSDRAVKYGLLFIVLTFVAVALVEALGRRRVHPIQYLLVGSALSVFFLLLLSLSEHLAFGLAYGLASLACVALLSFYASHMLGGRRAGIGFGAGVATLYGALFVLLQLEQTALVMGSLLLFAVLATVMVLTRRLDWYGLFDAARSGSPGPAGRSTT